jgi:hypothetical protein
MAFVLSSSHISKLYILQSFPSTDHIRSGRLLADQMAPVLPVHFSEVANIPSLFKELEAIKAEMEKLPAPAVLHFDCHGNENGIALFDAQDQQSFLLWEDFRTTFRDLYITAPHKPLISFSSCNGFYVMKLIAQYAPGPYDAIAGCLRPIGFQESIDAFALFYTELVAGTQLVDAAAKVAEQFPTLKFLAAAALVLAVLAWEKYKQKLTPEAIAQRKQEILAQVRAITGDVTPAQIALLDAWLTQDSGDGDQQRHMDIFSN